MSLLRDVIESDLPVFFEHQRDPEAIAMADFPARDREAFDAHWERVLGDETLTAKTIVFEGQVAGNIGSWEQDGRRLVGYWLGKEFWGKGSPRRPSPSSSRSSARARCTHTSRRRTSARFECSRSAASCAQKRTRTSTSSPRAPPASRSGRRTAEAALIDRVHEREVILEQARVLQAAGRDGW